MFGDEKSDMELMAAVDATGHLVGKDIVIQFVTKDGKWAISRHPQHAMGRGDESSIAEHYANIAEIGLLQEIGGDPYMVAASFLFSLSNFAVCLCFGESYRTSESNKSYNTL